MRKILCLVLSLCLLLLTGCKQEAPEIEVPVNFFYCAREVTFHSEQGVFQVEQREAKDTIHDYVALMNLYLSGPISEHLTSPFPRRLAATAVTIRDGNVTIALNSALATLTDIRLTKACACIALTLFDLTQANTVTIHAAVPAFGESQSRTFSRQEIALLDMGAIESE